MHELELEKAKKLAELNEMTAILEGKNLFEDLDNMQSTTGRQVKAKKRKTKVDEIESLIMGADKALHQSRDRLASSMLLMSDVKSGILHLAHLLKMNTIKSQLLAESLFSDIDRQNNVGVGGNGRNRGRDDHSSDTKLGKVTVIVSALNSIEERLGQMVDMLEIVQQSRKHSLSRRKQSASMIPSNRKLEKKKS